MKPLVVTAYLAGPLLDGGQPIHLDGLLGLAYQLRHRSAAPCRRSRRAELYEQHLPLLRLVHDGAAVWAASAAEPVGPCLPGLVHQTRRRDPEDWDRLEHPVQVSAGPLKDVLLRRRGTVQRAVRWYAWGVRHEVRKALKLLLGPEDAPHGSIGSARRSGAGQVTSWSIEVGTHTIDRCLIRDGVAARHLPAAWAASASTWWWGAVSPPYWLPDGHQDVPRVGAEVELHPAVLQAARVAAGC